MKMKDIRSTPIPDLKEKLAEVRKELMKSNAQIAVGTTPSNPGKVKTMKRTIAKIVSHLQFIESKEQKIKKEEEAKN